jgi:hypothetical protein
MKGKGKRRREIERNGHIWTVGVDSVLDGFSLHLDGHVLRLRFPE